MAQETGRLERSKNKAEAYEENDDGRSNETELIQANIEETRSDMGESIDAIQDRLSFSNISEKVSEKVTDAVEIAKDTAYDATVGKAVNFIKQAGNGIMDTSAVKTVKENPLPFALIGIGSAVLIYNSYSRSNSRRRSSNYSKYRTREYITPKARGNKQGMLGGAADSLTEKANQAYERVTNGASSTLSRTSDIASRAYDRLGEFGTSAQETYERYIDERPLAVVAAAAAVGAAIGFALPSTPYEGELMGDARQNALARAEEKATELVDKAKDVVSDVTEHAGGDTGR